MIIRTCLDKFAHCQALVSGARCPASGAIWEKFKSIEGSNYWFRTEYWTTLFLFDTNLYLVLSFISKFLLFERGFSQRKREENCFRKSSSVSAENLDEDQYEILLSVEAFVFEVHGPKARIWTFMCVGERGVKGLIRRLWMALWSSRRLGKLDCTFNYLWV